MKRKFKLIKIILSFFFISLLFSGCVYRKVYVSENRNNCYEAEYNYENNQDYSYKREEFVYMDNSHSDGIQVENLFFATIFYIFLSIFNSDE